MDLINYRVYPKRSTGDSIVVENVSLSSRSGWDILIFLLLSPLLSFFSSFARKSRGGAYIFLAKWGTSGLSSNA